MKSIQRHLLGQSFSLLAGQVTVATATVTSVPELISKFAFQKLPEVEQDSTVHQGLTWVTFRNVTVVPPNPRVLGVAPDPPPRGRVPAVVAFLVGVACLCPDLALEASLRDGSSAGVVLALGAGLLASSAWGGGNGVEGKGK